MSPLRVGESLGVQDFIPNFAHPKVLLCKDKVAKKEAASAAGLCFQAVTL